jgi:3'-5' exoribonuclease
MSELSEKTGQFNDLLDGKLVSDIHIDDQVSTILKVLSKKLQNTRDGKTFLLLTLGDRSGTIRAIDWNNSKYNDERLSIGNIVKVNGKVSLFDGRPQLNIANSRDAVKILGETDFDPNKFIEITSKNIRKMYDTLLQNIQIVSNDKIRSLLTEIFVTDDRFVSEFIEAPAAMNVHHAYKGGLLEHTVDVVELAKKLVQSYPEMPIELDLVIAGSLLHDIGKVEEYSVSPTGIDRSDDGELIGHIVIGINHLTHCATKIPLFPKKILSELQHIVLSHHGEIEWGSPVLPKTIEAFIVHTADNVDSKIAQFREYTQKAMSSIVNPDDTIWSDFNKYLSRRIRVKGVVSYDGKKEN